MLTTVQKGKLIRQILVWCLVFCLDNINISYGSLLDSNLRSHECGASALPLSCNQPLLFSCISNFDKYYTVKTDIQI